VSHDGVRHDQSTPDIRSARKPGAEMAHPTITKDDSDRPACRGVQAFLVNEQEATPPAVICAVLT